MKMIYADIATLLLELEGEMRRLALWQNLPPAPQALASSEPFCIDTLTFPQWLQFIFVPRMSQLIEAEQPLPCNSGITPLAEEYFKGGDYAARALLEVLAELDLRLQRG